MIIPASYADCFQCLFIAVTVINTVMSKQGSLATESQTTQRLDIAIAGKRYNNTTILLRIVLSLKQTVYCTGWSIINQTFCFVEKVFIDKIYV